MKKFCAILRKRSSEHVTAFQRVTDLPGIMVSILRQELDSMIRVIFLLKISDMEERQRLVTQTLSGQAWTKLTKKGKNKKITDRDMVEISNELQGWTESVYKFGCSFIHLSNFHNYSEDNPFELLSYEEKVAIIQHMRHYHGGPYSDTPDFEEFAFYFPDILRKITGNLEYYIEELESGKILGTS